MAAKSVPAGTDFFAFIRGHARVCSTCNKICPSASTKKHPSKRVSRQDRIRFDRQQQRECRASSDFGLDLNAALMGFDDVADDRQAESGAAGGAALAGLVRLVEALEDERNVLLRDALPFILDLQSRLPPPALRSSRARGGCASRRGCGARRCRANWSAPARADPRPPAKARSALPAPLPPGGCLDLPYTR